MARSTEAKTTSTKKKPTKARSRSRAKKNGKAQDKGPLELVIQDETLKHKVAAAALLFDREDKRVIADVQQKVNEMLTKAKRNDPKWKAAQKKQKDAFNELIKKATPGLPEGYALHRINAEDGTYVAIFNPGARGDLVQ